MISKRKPCSRLIYHEMNLLTLRNAGNKACDFPTFLASCVKGESIVKGLKG